MCLCFEGVVWQCTNCRRAGRPASEAHRASPPHLQFPWLKLLRSGRSQLRESPDQSRESEALRDMFDDWADHTACRSGALTQAFQAKTGDATCFLPGYSQTPNCLENQLVTSHKQSPP